MPYTFRVVFSGPCAYVPNIVEGDKGPAKSWSVVLPYFKDGWTGETCGDKIPVDRHLAVVQFPEAKFCASASSDIRIAIRNDDGSYGESGLYLLHGHRVTFDLPGAEALQVVEQEIGSEVMSNQDAVLGLLKNCDPKVKSMSWLPSMAWLREGLQWFGNDKINYFRGDGFPLKGSVAGHVLLTNGCLGTHEIDTVPTQAEPMMPTIWEFRPPNAQVDGRNHRQALAKSIALEVNGLTQPVTITVADSPQEKRTLTLKEEFCTGEIEIYIKNRELEEIFLNNMGEFEPQPVDLDFRYMYTQAQGYVPNDTNYPLPYLFKSGDGGNERGTCGGHRFSGYSKAYQPMVRYW